MWLPVIFSLFFCFANVSTRSAFWSKLDLHHVPTKHSQGPAAHQPEVDGGTGNCPCWLSMASPWNNSWSGGASARLRLFFCGIRQRLLLVKLYFSSSSFLFFLLFSPSSSYIHVYSCILVGLLALATDQRLLPVGHVGKLLLLLRPLLLRLPRLPLPAHMQKRKRKKKEENNVSKMGEKSKAKNIGEQENTKARKKEGKKSQSQK